MKNFSLRFITQSGLLLAAALTFPFCALGQANQYPERPVILIVPFAAGGGGDLLARLVADPLSRELQQPIIIDNKAGAGGNIGMVAASRAEPNGYTLAYGTNGMMAINQWLYKNPGFTPKSFEPISRFSMIPLALAVENSASFRSVQELIEFAKKNPGRLTCGSAGNGTSTHISCELLKQMASIDVVHVPYKGSGAAMTDLLGGRISFVIDIVPNLSAQVAAGKVRLLAVTTKSRLAVAPNVPTFDEQAVKGYEFFAWDGLYAPKGTPKAIVDKLSEAVRKVLQSPTTQKMLADRGAVPAGTTSAELGRFGAYEFERLGPIVKSSGASLD